MKSIFMINKLTIVLLILPFLTSFCLASEDEGMGMVTGGPKGTYIKFGRQIAEQAKKEKLNILVLESGGSLDNIRRINSPENAALGIVQSDVLGFIQQDPENPQFKKFIRHLRLIHPLYNEEVHIFADKNIRKFEDLQGKKVYVGKLNSGNYVTSKNLLHKMGIVPSEIVTNLTPKHAAYAVGIKKIDAMVYVAGKPVELFENIGTLKKNQETAKHFIDTHFVTIDNPKILKGAYVKSRISKEDYDWVEKEVPTVAVKAVLIGYDFSKAPNPEKEPYFRMRCRQLKQLSQIIRNDLGLLKANGHPKWKEVDLYQEIGVWQLDTCSRSVRRERAPLPSTQTDDLYKSFDTVIERTPRNN